MGGWDGHQTHVYMALRQAGGPVPICDRDNSGEGVQILGGTVLSYRLTDSAYPDCNLFLPLLATHNRPMDLTLSAFVSTRLITLKSVTLKPPKHAQVSHQFGPSIHLK